MVRTTDIVLHIVNLEEMIKIIKNLENNINNIKIDNKELLQTQLRETENKLSILYLDYNRQKRGLVNVVGNSAKWLFGTMDDDDRKIIEQHLNNLGDKNREIEENLDQQIYIYINEYFNVTVCILKI